MSQKSGDHATLPGPILYAGSVKNVRAYGGIEGDELCFEFTDRYSVFDWGEMPQQIPGKGQALAVIGAVLFERLADPALWLSYIDRQFPESWTRRLSPEGIRVLERLKQKGLLTHYRGLVGPEGTRVESWRKLTGVPSGMIVQKLEIQHPTLTESGYVYELKPAARPRLVPLEVVFRHRLTEGSSILERRPDLRPGMQFKEPLTEFFTKLEPRDRFLPREEALQVGGLSEAKLSELEVLTKATAGILEQWFGEEHLELVDGKLEWAITPDGDFMLVDAIGPDELRIETRDEVEISKEVFRRFYRTTAWYREMKSVKAKIDASGETVENWQVQVQSDPPRVPERIIRGFAGCLHALSARLAKRDFFGGGRLEKLAHELTVDPGQLRHGKVLLIGNGGREHALAWKILQSPQVKSLHWYPGNEAATMLLVQDSGKEVIRVTDVKHEAAAVAEFARSEKIELVVIGPDQFLADGWTDVLLSRGLRVFGPTQAAARLEWSKSFSKEILAAANVPTAASFLVKTEAEFRERLLTLSWEEGRKWVFKADGLALGKGVKICSDAVDALNFGRGWLNQGHPVLIEEFLLGDELSWFGFCDGETCALLDPARDYKTLNEGGMGPNTGGMGAISPVPGFGSDWERKIREKVFMPVLQEMKARGVPYHGLLYAGLMVHGNDFWVLEFNARFGDPETQVLLPRMEGDIIPWLLASAEGTLAELPGRVPFQKSHGTYIVLASRGYPERPETGFPIEGLPERNIFLASVVRKGSDLLTSGGRVLGVLGLGESAEAARSEAYSLASRIRFEGAQYRSDIGGSPPRARMVVLVSGRGSNFEALAREARESSYPGEVVCLISNKENAPALDKARELGIPVRVTREDADLIRVLQELKPDVIVLAGYMKILPAELIEKFRLPNGKSRILNIHPSLLPDLPGMHSYRRAFEEKRAETGVTVHEVEAEVDSGPILAQESFSIRELRSPEEVEKVGLALEHRIFPAAIRSWILQNWRPHAEKV